jgi:hypothetical protein
MAKTESHTCRWEQSKRGAFEVCATCKDRFPCAEDTCGHLDCIEKRAKPARCHFCRRLVEGPRNDDWGTGNVRGITRAFHYTCKENKDAEDRSEEAGDAAA